MVAAAGRYLDYQRNNVMKLKENHRGQKKYTYANIIRLFHLALESQSQDIISESIRGIPHV